VRFYLIGDSQQVGEVFRLEGARLGIGGDQPVAEQQQEGDAYHVANVQCFFYFCRAMLSAKILTELLDIKVEHALYQENGLWYHVLRQFPGALFDKNGVLIFNTKHEYDNNPSIRSGKELNVTGGIASLPGYRAFTPQEKSKIDAFMGKKAIDEEQAWATFLQTAQQYFAAQEVFLSPFHQQRYMIDRLGPNSVRIKRLDVPNSSETMGSQKFSNCIKRINQSPFPIPKGSIYEHVAEEVALVALLPMLDWSEDGHFIVFADEEFPKEPVKGVPEAPNDNIDRRIQVQLKKRLGQRKLRDKLFYEYGGQCAISNCPIREVLHACHILAFAQAGNNLSTNAILLRSDLHDLFDANLLAIHPETFAVQLHPNVSLHYRGLNNIVNERRDQKRLDREGLNQRWALFRKMV
jgi:hypothetical protein